MGGEKCPGLDPVGGLWGSPPRGRGKADATPHGFLAEGITPAWAGKSARGLTLWAGCGDHPRVGGEKLMPPLMGFWLRGSPPRRREKAENLLPEICLPGSPPRGRGKEGALQSGKHRHGITPAWAGKRRPQQRHRMALQDHPRMSGEKLSLTVSVQHAMGSPPHGRGKARHLSHGLLPCG